MSREHSPDRDNDGPVGHDGSDASEPDRVIDESECCRLTTLSRTTRWRMMKQGRFPQKFQLSPNRGGWWLSKILKWLRDQEAA